MGRHSSGLPANDPSDCFLLIQSLSDVRGEPEPILPQTAVAREGLAG